MGLILILLVVVVVSAAPPVFEEFGALIPEADTQSLLGTKATNAHEDSEKEELTTPTDDSPDSDFEVFQAPKENDTELAQLLREFNPYNLLHGGTDMRYLSERAKYLASLPRQHRAQLFEYELPTAHKKSDRVMAGFQAVELFNNLKNMNSKPSSNLEECDESRRAAIADLQSLALNASLMEVRLELLEMAQERAEKQSRSAIMDVLDCHKHMAVLEYIKNDTHRSMEAMNFTMEQAKEEALQCKMSKIKLESQIEAIESQKEDEHSNYRTAKKSLDEMQIKFLEAEAEVKMLKEEIKNKKEEKENTDDKMEELRQNLMELRTNVTNNNNKEDANLQLDTLESLNDLLVTQMDIMTHENEALRTTHEKEMEQLVQELDQCDDAKLQAQKHVLYSGELCSVSRIDAAMNENSSTVILFKGSYYWVMTEDDGITHDVPSLINETWPDAPPEVDAAFYNEEEESVYFFYGSQYWQYKDFELQPDFPKEISEGFPGVPDNIDAAFIWKITGKLYLFKDESYYWRSGADDTYTAHGIHAKFGGAGWHGGVPLNLDAIFEFHGSTIFVKKDLYYRYSDSSNTVAESLPPYPRLSCTWLFGCPASSECAQQRRV